MTPPAPSIRGAQPDEHAAFRQDSWQVGYVEQVVSKTVNKTYVTNAPAATLPEPPEVLRYLIDRSEQAAALERMTQSLLAETAPRLAACFVAGPRNELHEALMRRYRDVILPNLLESLRLQDAIHYRRLTWPEAGSGARTGEARYANLCAQLQRELAVFEIADEEDEEQLKQRLSRALDDLDGHMVLRVNLYGECWCAGEPTLLERWLRLWTTLSPRLGASPQLRLLFICVNYEPGRKPFLGRWFGTAKSARNMRACIERLLGLDLPDVYVLPELAPIERSHVSEWATTTVPQAFRHVDECVLQVEAEQAFQSNEPKPFEELVLHLKEALKKACNDGRVVDQTVDREVMP